MNPQHACPFCRAALPRGVTHCPECGASLEALLEMPEPGKSAAAPTTALAPAAAPVSPDTDATKEMIAGYAIIQRHPLQTCAFYQMADPASGETYLSRLTPRPQALGTELRDALTQLAGHGLPNVLEHLSIQSTGQHSFVLLRHPGAGWRSLSLVPAPVPLALALAWTRQAGAALQAIAGHGLGRFPPGLAGREGFIVDQHNQLMLADLSLCLPLAEDEPPSSRPLASILYYLTTGKELPAAGQPVAPAPEPVLALVQRALAGQSLASFLQELAAIATPPAARTRALRQLAGAATDTGRKRDSNEDWVATLSYTLDRTGQSLPLGLYIVADGMGGYAGGEHASSSGIRQPLLRFIEQEIVPDLQNETRRLSPDVTPEGRLKAMIQLANERVYENRRRSGGERGSTITAAMILGDSCIVANVGDSRTYLYRDGALRQVTEDHSLVARLVQAGEIGPEEIYTHQQRNKVYRSLGDRLDTPVDTFSLQLEAGDRLLLCSDGLWEMVRDAQIAALLAANPNPQLACDELLAAANAGGGEDNISAVVIDMQ